MSGCPTMSSRFDGKAMFVDQWHGYHLVSGRFPCLCLLVQLTGLDIAGNVLEHTQPVIALKGVVFSFGDAQMPSQKYAGPPEAGGLGRPRQPHDS